VEECCQVVPSTLPTVGSEAFTTTFWLKLADWSSGGTAGGQVLTWDKESTKFNVAVGGPSGGANAGRLYVYTRTAAGTEKKSWVVLDEATGGENLTDGQWAHFAIVVDAAGDVTYYVNGDLKTADGTGNAYSATAVNTTFIGARAAGGCNDINTELQGVLDDLAVFKGALTEAQIEGVMTYGVPEPGTFVLLVGPLAVWGVRRRSVR